jgi:hypothetical protein
MKGLVAVLTLVFIPQKDIAARKGGTVLTLGNIFVQGNDTGKGNLQIGRANLNIVIDIYHSDLAIKDGLDGLLPVTNA